MPTSNISSEEQKIRVVRSVFGHFKLFKYFNGNYGKISNILTE